MVNLKTYASSGKADTSGFVPYTGGTTDLVFPFNIHIDADDKKLLFGDGGDSSISDNGTNMILDTDEQGVGPGSNSRCLRITGAVVNTIITWSPGSAEADVEGGNVFLTPTAGRDYTVDTLNNGTAGQIITLIGNVGADVTLNESGNIVLGTLTTRIITDKDTWTAIYDGAKWCEIGYSNNQ